ncbi:MAG: hypothetical protein A2Y78_11385 [Acidobacteria bacterium RBG_13_68_16]|nr:MAG: hypothetical protein A2Y78_11385 [Acidobacteria bacterium RBG_13_68_16]
MRLYKRARYLGPKLADPWVALARAELARSRRDAAQRDLETALTLEPNHPEANIMLVQLKQPRASATAR